MTNQEAKNWIKAISATQEQSIHKSSLSNRKEALYIAIQALEELERYRVIGTVEEFDNAMCFELAKENKELSNAVDEYLQYVKLGTVEEFKALKEKSVAKKIQYDEYGKEEGYPYCECGKCLIDDFVGVSYCPDCGKKLDWQ